LIFWKFNRTTNWRRNAKDRSREPNRDLFVSVQTWRGDIAVSSQQNLA